MSDAEIFSAIAPVVRCFEKNDIPYCIGGSVAGSLHGYARSTMDVDLMADIHEVHVSDVVVALRDTYYVSESMIRESVRTRKCFNVMLLETMFKVDVFPQKRRDFDQSAMDRRQRKALHGTTTDLDVWVTSVEDMVLFKLEWYDKGNQVSERQWLDVQNVLRVQGDNIDTAYLRQWAPQLEVDSLLVEALAEAGLTS